MLRRSCATSNTFPTARATSSLFLLPTQSTQLRTESQFSLSSLDKNYLIGSQLQLDAEATAHISEIQARRQKRSISSSSSSSSLDQNKNFKIGTSWANWRDLMNRAKKLHSTDENNTDNNKNNIASSISKSLDSIVGDPNFAPRTLADDLSEVSKHINSASPLVLRDHQYAVLLLRQLWRSTNTLDGKFASSLVGKESVTWATSSASPSSSNRRRRLVNELDNLEKFVSQLDRLVGNKNNNTNKSITSVRVLMRKAALLRNADAATKLLDSLIAQYPSQLRHRDFHVAMSSTRTMRFDQPAAQPSPNPLFSPSFTSCVGIYKKMIKSAKKPTIMTIAILANSASVPKDAETVLGLWKAMLLSRTSAVMNPVAASTATAALVRCIGRSFRFDKLQFLENERQKIIQQLVREQQQEQQEQEQNEESNDKHNNDDDFEKDLRGEGSDQNNRKNIDTSKFPPSVLESLAMSPLEMIERIVTELVDALPRHRSVFYDSALLQGSIAVALADLGESLHLGQLLARFYRAGSGGGALGRSGKASSSASARLLASTASSINSVNVSNLPAGVRRETKQGVESDATMNLVNGTRSGLTEIGSFPPNQSVGPEAALSFAGSGYRNSKRATRTTTQFLCLPYECCLISALNRTTLTRIEQQSQSQSQQQQNQINFGFGKNNNNTSSFNGREETKLAIVECLETFVQQISRRRMPLPSATNMVLSSLLLYSASATSPSDEAATLALQGCFFVAGVIKRLELGYDSETLQLLLRAVEGTALVSIALHPENTMDVFGCESLLSSAKNFVDAMRTSDKTARKNIIYGDDNTTSLSASSSSLFSVLEYTINKIEEKSTTTSPQVVVAASTFVPTSLKISFNLGEYTSMMFLMSLGLSVFYTSSSAANSNNNLSQLPDEEQCLLRIRDLVREFDKKTSFSNFMATSGSSELETYSLHPSGAWIFPLLQNLVSVKRAKDWRRIFSCDDNDENNKQIALMLCTFPISASCSSTNKSSKNNSQLVVEAVQRLLVNNENTDNNNNKYSKIIISEQVLFSSSEENDVDLIFVLKELEPLLKSKMVEFASPYAIAILHSTVARNEASLNQQEENNNNINAENKKNNNNSSFNCCHVFQFTDVVDDLLKHNDQKGVSRFCKISTGLDNCPVLSDDFWAQEAVRLRLTSNTGPNRILEASPYENFSSHLYRPMMENLLEPVEVETSRNNDIANIDNDDRMKNADELLKSVLKRWTL